MNKKQSVFKNIINTGIPFVIMISLGIVIILSFVLSATPFKTLKYFFFGPFQNLYYFGNMLNSAIPLVFGGLGISIAMTSDNFNLGGEGQVYSGAFTTTIVAVALAPLGIFGGFIALLAGALLAGIIGGLSGYFKMKWSTSELITSFLLSNAVVLIVNYFITGPFLDPETNLLATRKVPEVMRLHKILPPSSLSTGAIYAVIAVFLVYMFMYKTRTGYELRVCGANPRFAAYGGLDIKKNMVLPMFISGAFYGLGGGLAIYGTFFSCMKEFHVGLGWNGLAVALIARFKPKAVIPAAIFFAWIGSGAKIAMQRCDVTLEIASIVQAVVFFLITCEVFQRNYFKKKEGISCN